MNDIDIGHKPYRGSATYRSKLGLEKGIVKNVGLDFYENLINLKRPNFRVFIRIF